MGKSTIKTHTMKNAQLMTLSIHEIQLDKENPRIKQYLEFYTQITSEMLALALSDSSNGDASTTYRSLKESIKVSGGIIHPIVVNQNEDGSYTVIEGNTRLQIYKEFHENDTEGSWETIPCLVYQRLSSEEKHEIRLQSHLVGPREWDPYSKAKYLYELSEKERLPMNRIIDMCGGGKNEIQKAIDAYIDMELYYRQYCKSSGFDFSTRDFSKFREFQNGTVKQSLLHKGFDSRQFAIWVAEGNVDIAQKVRIIPKVLKNEEATIAFKKKNLTEAEKVLNANELVNADLSQYPYETLSKALYQKLLDFKISEIQSLAKDYAFAEKKYALESLKEQLDFIINEVKEKE